MIYKVKVEKRVGKYINKLGTRERDYFISRFNELQYNKSGYRLLDKHGIVELWELRCSSHRVYYTVENGYIVIENIEYDGNIRVRDASNKNQQQRTIDHLKNRYIR